MSAAAGRSLAGLRDRLGRVWVALLLMGAGLLPLQIVPPMPLPGMQLSDLFFALAFGCFLLSRPRWPPAALTVPLALFALGAVVSTAFGGSPVKLLGHLELAALALMAAALAQSSARALRLALVVGACLGALTVMAGVALFYAGIETMLLNHHGVLAGDSYPRGRGTMIRAQMMASVVLTGLMLLWFEPGLIGSRVWRIAACALILAAAFFAFSRTLPAALLLLAGALLWQRRGPRWAWAALALTALVYLALLWVSIRYQIVLNPLRPWEVEVIDPDWATVTIPDGIRYSFWRDAVATIAQRPILGVGPGTGVPPGWTAHNTWLNVWGTLGIVPLIAFAWLAAAGLAGAWRAGQAGVAAVLGLLLFESLYTDIEDMRHYWLVLGLGFCTASQSIMAEQRRP